MTLSGWDATSSLALSVVNKQLQTNTGLSGAAFDFQDTANGMTIAGHFGAWQIVRGGSNSLVLVAITLTDGKYTVGTSAPLDLAGVVVTLEMSLKFMSSATPNCVELRFDYSTTGAVGNQGSVQVKDIALPAGSPVPVLSKLLVAEAVLQCVANNPAGAAHIFASLATTANTSARYYIPAPTAYAFTYAETAGGDGAYFSILSTLGGPDLVAALQAELSGASVQAAQLASEIAVLQQAGGIIGVMVGPLQTALQTINNQVATLQSAVKQAQVLSSMPSSLPTTLDPALFDASALMAVGLSPYYFLSLVLLPQLPAIYNLRPASVFRAGGVMNYLPSPDLDHFKYSYTDNHITNTCTLPMPSVSAGGINYNPQIDGLTISINDTALTTTLNGSCHISSGIDLTFTYTSGNTLTATSTGVAFAPDPNASFDHNIDESTWAKIGNVFSLDSLNGIINAIGDSIGHSINNNIGNLGVSQLSPGFITWPGFSNTGIVSAGLNDILYFRGN